MDNETSEIEKLTERISTDPKSKLFVPLAEEYKKRGDIEMSIHVLTEGLKNNPGYVTAKSFLGRLLFEKGDLAGAQKEFEEVVKTIPDNLLAQRKLGDIYALQENVGNALVHYRSAQALNQRDEEVASLISDLEAGKSVKERLQKPKPQAAAAPVKPKPAPAAPSPAPAGKPASGVPPVIAAPKQPASAPRRAEAEEAEEVVLVEPLEPEVPAHGAVAGGFDFLAESGEQPARPSEGPSDNLFDVAAAMKTSEEMSGASGAPLPGSGEAGEEVVAAAPAASDDFTTNTLAELYIAQGFYEKAIDIYDRMLAENPGNQALQEKLKQVRAMAAQAGPAGEPATEAVAVAQSDEQPLWTDMPGPLPTDRGPSDEPAPPTVGPLNTAPFDVGFEPVEYKAPEAGPRRGAGEEMKSGAAGPVPAGRKKTIDRLEQWLKAIEKEKER